MISGSLSARLEYAILDIVMRWPGDTRAGQQYLSGWEESVRRLVPDVTMPNLKSAFKRLGKRQIVNLTKPDSQSRDAYPYSGKSSDDNSFFHTGPFNVNITDEGVSYWDGLNY